MSTTHHLHNVPCVSRSASRNYHERRLKSVPCIFHSLRIQFHGSFSAFLQHDRSQPPEHFAATAAQSSSLGALHAPKPTEPQISTCHACLPSSRTPEAVQKGFKRSCQRCGRFKPRLNCYQGQLLVQITAPMMRNW